MIGFNPDGEPLKKYAEKFLNHNFPKKFKKKSPQALFHCSAIFLDKDLHRVSSYRINRTVVQTCIEMKWTDFGFQLNFLSVKTQVKTLELTDSAKNKMNFILKI